MGSNSRSTNSQVALTALWQQRRGLPLAVRDEEFGLDLSAQHSVPACGEVRPPWLELRGGYDFCSLCSHFATDGHLASEGHRRRVQ